MLRLNLYTACLAAVFTHSFFTAMRLALAVVTLKLTQTPATVGLVLMAYALLPALLSPAVGRIADRHGVQALLGPCLCLLFLAGPVLWLLPHHIAVLTMAAALIGLGFNCFAVSIQKIIGGLPPSNAQSAMSVAERRKRNFGTLATASSVSSFCGPLLAGWVLDSMPAAVAFGVLALLPMLALAISRGWKFPQPVAPATAGVLPATPVAQRSPLLEPGLRPLIAAIVMMTVAGDALGFFTPLIGAGLGISAIAVGGIVSAFALGAFAIRLTSGLFIAKLPEWRYISLSLLASAALLLVFGQTASTMALWSLSFALGAWLGLAQPMTQSLLHQSVPENRVGEALGARLALVGGAQAASPLLFGLGAQYLGITASLVAASVLLCAGGLYAAQVARAS